jgi:glucans biosynthesis protein
MQRRLAMLESRRCGAKTRKGIPCRSPAMPNGRCRMHGGKSTGAPKGNKNAWKHGHYSKGAKAGRALLKNLLTEAASLRKLLSKSES